MFVLPIFVSGESGDKTGSIPTHMDKHVPAHMKHV